MSTRAALAAAAAVVAPLALAACSGADEVPEGAGPTSLATTALRTTESESRATPGGSPSPYLPVPRKVGLTDPGSELGVGEMATIAWRPPPDDEVGVLDVRVRRLVRSDIAILSDWQLDAAGRSSALYYVTVTVTNMGGADLSGQRVPLYVVDGTGALVESSEFKTEFDPCRSPDLPEGFVTGERVTLCLAYLVPERGDLTAVAFRPVPRFNPITWVGEVTDAQQPKKPKGSGAAQ